MTPYIDTSGFRWLRRIFEAAQRSVEKIVVLRDTQRCEVELGALHHDWLHALGISVRDYHLSHDVAGGRAVPIETFHSKILVADDALAYVGSANLLASSEGLSLESGFLVEGQPAVQVSRLIDGVLRVARSL
jgi:phosphatidylserine/phosphatidylglycerophosphate/cardiolipin synthase-like enzyme